MVEQDWCPADWYVIYPVALLPGLEPGSFKYSEQQRSNSCMQAGTPWRTRIGRQFRPREPRDCCYYHSVNWKLVAREAIRIAQLVPLAAMQPPWFPDGDSAEAQAAYDKAHEPLHRVDDLVEECGLPGRERKALDELLSPGTAIVIQCWPGSRGIGYTNGRHRAHALITAGVHFVPVIRSHCCQPAVDCAPWWLRCIPRLPAEHMPGCELA